jgi:hypothetical protein
VAPIAPRSAKLLNDVGQIATSTEKVTRRAARIDAMEFSEEADKVETQPGLRLATGGEQGAPSARRAPQPLPRLRRE